MGQADGVSPSIEVFFPTLRGELVLDGRRKGDGPWGKQMTSGLDSFWRQPDPGLPEYFFLVRLSVRRT